MINNFNSYISNKINKCPDACAIIKGSSKYPLINGKVEFFQTPEGVLVVANVTGLPYTDKKCESAIYAFHIHAGEECTGNETDEFANAKGHFNPEECMHPFHAGDMPPLFGNNGFVWSSFITNRFNIVDIIGHVVIIHEKFDDFSTQPSGNAGKKIACGIIK